MNRRNVVLTSIRKHTPSKNYGQREREEMENRVEIFKRVKLT